MIQVHLRHMFLVLALALMSSSVVGAQSMDSPLSEPPAKSEAVPAPKSTGVELGERVESLESIRLKVVIPEDWYLSQRTGDESETSFLLASVADKEEQALFFVSATPKNGRTMEYMTTTTYHYVYTKMDGFVEVEEDIKVLGEPAYLLVYEGESRLDSEPRKKFYRVVLEHDNLIYVFQGVCSRKYFQKYKGTFAGIVEGAFWMKDN